MKLTVFLILLRARDFGQVKLKTGSRLRGNLLQANGGPLSLWRLPRRARPPSLTRSRTLARLQLAGWLARSACCQLGQRQPLASSRARLKSRAGGRKLPALAGPPRRGSRAFWRRANGPRLMEHIRLAAGKCQLLAVCSSCLPAGWPASPSGQFERARQTPSPGHEPLGPTGKPAGRRQANWEGRAELANLQI